MDFFLDESVGFLISKTSLKMKNHLYQHFKPFDITSEQWGLLARLWETDRVSQKELADKTCKDQPNITRILDKLEGKGLIKREANPDDRRAFVVHLTDEGQKLKEVLVPIVKESLALALKGIPHDEVEQLKGLLNKIYNNLL